jgi:DNA replication protein DnaT
MSRHATDWAWETDPGSSSLKLILLSMADRADEYNLCYPSIERLVKDTCLNKKTVQAGLISLMKMGLISDTGERKGATKRVRVFSLNITKNGNIKGNREGGNEPENGNVPENGNIPSHRNHDRNAHMKTHRRCPLLGWCSYLMGHHTSAHFPMSDAQST